MMSTFRYLNKIQLSLTEKFNDKLNKLELKITYQLTVKKKKDKSIKASLLLLIFSIQFTRTTIIFSFNQTLSSKTNTRKNNNIHPISSLTIYFAAILFHLKTLPRNSEKMQLSFASGLLMLAAACVASPAPANAPVARAAEPQVPGPGEYPGPYDFLGQTTGPWDWCAPTVYVCSSPSPVLCSIDYVAQSPCFADVDPLQCQFDRDCAQQEDCKRKAGGKGDLARCGWGVWPRSCWTWT